jgi:Flp pilus assembly protein TadD
LRAFPVAVAIAIYAPYAVAAVEDDLRDGDKYFDAGDWKRAAAAYDRAIAKGPGQVAAEAYGKRAAIYIIQKDFKGGLAFIERAKQRYPNAPEVLEQEALMLWQENRKDDAIKVAEQVTKSRPQAFTNQALVGEYYEQRDPVKVAGALEAYFQYRPSELEKNDALPRIRLGFAYLANGQSVLVDGDETRAQTFYTKGKEQFEIVQRKHKDAKGAKNADNGLCAAYVGLGSWDQAISVCERVIADQRRIDARGSAYYNTAIAFLARRQLQKARAAGNEFLRIRKNEARGYMLIGDTFFQENNWNMALDNYLRAEKALRPNQVREQGQLAIKLGKTYLRLPAPAGAQNPNLNLAIEKLSVAFQNNPNNTEVGYELGNAYLKAKQDNKASALSERMINAPEFAKVSPERRAAIFVVSAKSLFNQEKLTEARQRFEAARQIRPTDVQIKRGLIDTINEQAFKELTQKDFKQADALLGEALKIDQGHAKTLTNVAVLLLDQGNCNQAESHLNRLGGVRGHNAVLTQRLLARSLLCKSKPDPKKAAAAYEDAEKEAKKANALLDLAEIYTEWAPLIWDKNANEAVDKLEIAVQTAAQHPQIGPPAKRNLAIALYLRGWSSMRQGRISDAAVDFERAIRDPSVLKGNEPLAFEFSYALALLETNRAQDATRIFKNLQGKGSPSSYLKGAYAQVGDKFFAAYAQSKTGTNAQRANACQQLSAIQNQLGGNAKEIVASCWENLAYEYWRSNATAAAQQALAKAQSAAPADMRRRLENNLAVLGIGPGKRAQLEALSGSVAEALVNLGIVYDMMDKPRDAYDAWVRAKARGANARDLQKWIDAKKRIYGY